MDYIDRGIPRMIHCRAGLQRKIAHRAQVDMEQMNIAATYNVVNGDPAVFARSGLGDCLIGDDHLPQQVEAGLCFRPLDLPLTISHALVWDRYAVLSRAADAFLTQFR